MTILSGINPYFFSSLRIDFSLSEFALKASGADATLFYYAGHGLQFQGQNYFLPVDIEVQDSFDVQYQAVHQEKILEAIRQAPGVRIVVLHSCRDNPLAKLFATRSINGSEITRGLARIDRTEGLIIAYAIAPNSVAQDGVGRNSPFAEALIRRAVNHTEFQPNPRPGNLDAS